eukprot:jgi/Tetstr1/457346/TSEL_043949.t1
MEALPSTQPYDPGQYKDDTFWDDKDVDGIAKFEGQQRYCVRPCGVGHLLEGGYVPIQELITSLDNAGKYYLTTLFQLEIGGWVLMAWLIASCRGSSCAEYAAAR